MWIVSVGGSTTLEPHYGMLGCLSMSIYTARSGISRIPHLLNTLSVLGLLNLLMSCTSNTESLSVINSENGDNDNLNQDTTLGVTAKST